jgi:hypothetical protein
LLLSPLLPKSSQLSLKVSDFLEITKFGRLFLLIYNSAYRC